MAGSGIPVRKRVQAPSAPGFYRSCASRRTMGSAHRAGWFRGSYECCLRQRVPGPLWRWAGEIICILGSNRGKTIRPRLWREGNAPLLVPSVPPFPLRGKSPQGNRGAFPSGVSPVVRFSIPRSGIIKLIAQRAIPPPFEPSAPFEPSEPGPPQAAHYLCFTI